MSKSSTIPTKEMTPGSPEHKAWVEQKKEAKKKLDEKLGTGRNVTVREDRR